MQCKKLMSLKIIFIEWVTCVFEMKIPTKLMGLFLDKT